MIFLNPKTVSAYMQAASGSCEKVMITYITLVSIIILLVCFLEAFNSLMSPGN